MIAHTVTGEVRPKVAVERRFAAPVDELFAAWVIPERLVRWFVPGHYLAGASSCRISLQPGGTWSLQMVDPDGDEHAELETRLRKVRVPTLLSGATTATTRLGELTGVDLKLRFLPDAAGTLLRLRQGPLNSADQAAAITAFWSDALSRLDDYLAERRAAIRGAHRASA